MRVVAVGECTLDCYVDRDITCVGGISLNFALSAALEGAESVALVSCVGDDMAGDRLSTFLSGTPIDTSQLQRRVGSTATQRILLTPSGERSFPPGGYDPGVLATFTLSDSALALLAGADVVAVPIFDQLVHLSSAIIADHTLGKLRVADLLDAGDASASLARLPALNKAFDVLFVSGDESMVAHLRSLGLPRAAIVVVTLGAGGSCAIVDGEIVREPAAYVPPNEIVDTTGCGDAFQGAFAVDYARHRDVAAALRAGARSAARVIRHIGATIACTNDQGFV